MRNIKYLPPVPVHREDWFTWKIEVCLHRLRMIEETDEDHPNCDANRAREILRCQEDGLYLASVYGTIYEARPPEMTGEDEPAGGYVPFIPYPFQIEMWDDLDEMMATPKPDPKSNRHNDHLWVKSRTMGASNVAGFWVSHRWGFTQPFQARILSRKQDLVDATGDPDTLFWKIETFLKGLPYWLFYAMAGDFDWRRHRTFMRIRNPRNANAIIGESTNENAGRGGRASVIIYDEAAFMPALDQVYRAGQQSTRHRLLISTVETKEGMTFYHLHMATNGWKVKVKEWWWWMHPLYDDDWAEREKARSANLSDFMKEVLMDYFAGEGQWVYPEAQKIRPGRFTYLPYAGPVFLTFDDGFRDDWSMHLIQYITETGRHRVIDSYTSRQNTVAFYGTLITGIPRADFRYEARDVAWMMLMRQLPPVTIIGDAHTSNIEQITGHSLVTYLAQEFGIHVLFDPTKRSHSDRKIALSTLLPMFDFNDTEGVRYALEGLKRHRYPEQKDSSENVYEARNPVHDWTSHPADAFGWYAINFPMVRHMTAGYSFATDGPDNE